MSATLWYALGKWQQWLNDLILNGRTCKTPLWSFKVHTEITCVQWFYQPLVCDPNKWWHVSVRVTYSGRVQELNQTVHRCDIERELFHYMALVWYWFFLSCAACDPACCMYVVSPPFYYRRFQLWVWLLKVLCPVWLWGYPELRPHTHSSGTPRPCQVPSAGLYGNWTSWQQRIARSSSNLSAPTPAPCQHKISSIVNVYQI